MHLLLHPSRVALFINFRVPCCVPCPSTRLSVFRDLTVSNFFQCFCKFDHQFYLIISCLFLRVPLSISSGSTIHPSCSLPWSFALVPRVHVHAFFRRFTIVSNVQFFFICAFLDKFGQSFIQSVSYFASCVDCIRLLEFSHCVYLSLTLSAFPSGYNVSAPGFRFFTLYRTFCCSHAHFVTTFAVK